MSLMSSSLHLQQHPTSLVHLIWIVFEIGGRWPNSCCFVGGCFQDLFNIAFSILVQLLSSFFSIHLVNIHVVHPYCSMNMTAIWQKMPFILSYRSDFYLINNLLIAVHAFVSRVLMRCCF